MPRWSLTLLLLSAAAAASGLPESAPRRGFPILAALSGGARDGCLSASLSGDSDVSTAEAGRYAVLTVAADANCGATAQPIDLALVLDVSGSMAVDQKMEEAREAALRLLGHLTDGDRVALYTFADDVTELYPLGPPTSGVRALLGGLAPGGSTALHDAILTAGVRLPSAPGRSERIVVLTDGRDNRGTRDLAALGRRVAALGPTVSTIGLGTDYDEDSLAFLADAGRGSYRYASPGSDLGGLFLDELTRARGLALEDVEVHLSLPPGVSAEVLGWDTEQAGDTLTVALGDLSGGDTRHLTVRLAGAEAPGARVGARVEGDQPSAQGTPRAEVNVEATLDAPGLADPEATVAITRALAGQQVDAARAAWSQGDTDLASRRLARARRWLEALPTPPAEDLSTIAELQLAPPETATRTASEVSRALSKY